MKVSVVVHNLHQPVCEWDERRIDRQQSSSAYDDSQSIGGGLGRWRGSVRIGEFVQPLAYWLTTSNECLTSKHKYYANWRVYLAVGFHILPVNDKSINKKIYWYYQIKFKVPSATPPTSKQPWVHNKANQHQSLTLQNQAARHLPLLLHPNSKPPPTQNEQTKRATI